MEIGGGLIGPGDLGGFTVPEGIVRGEDGVAGGVDDVAVGLDGEDGDGVVEAEDDGLAVEGFGIEAGGAGDQGGEDDGAMRVFFEVVAIEADDVGEAAFAFFKGFSVLIDVVRFLGAGDGGVEDGFPRDYLGCDELAEEVV